MNRRDNRPCNAKPPGAPCPASEKDCVCYQESLAREKRGGNHIVILLFTLIVAAVACYAIVKVYGRHAF